jgi:hypothetical protein
VRHAINQRAAALVMLAHSWLAITFFRITYASAHTRFCVQATITAAFKLAAGDLATIHDPMKFLPRRK